MRLILLAGIPGISMARWATESARLAAERLPELKGHKIEPVIVEKFFSMSAIGRSDEPQQRLSSFLDLPPDDLNRVCSDAFERALQVACDHAQPCAVLCFHPVLYQSETRLFSAPYSADFVGSHVRARTADAIFVSLHDDIYDVCRRLQGVTTAGDLHILHPKRSYKVTANGSLERDPLRDIQNLLFLLDWRDRELMNSRALAAGIPLRHILFHRKGRPRSFWDIALNNAPAVYFSHPISQARRDLTGSGKKGKSHTTDRERGKRLMESCNDAADRLDASRVAVVEPTAIDELRLNSKRLSKVTASQLRQGFLPPLTPRWTLKGTRVDPPDGWNEVDCLSAFAPEATKGVSWETTSSGVKLLEPAIKILEHEIVRQITVRDHTLTQQAALVVAYHPYSLPDRPVMTGGVETEIMAMLRKAASGKPCCRPAIIVIHSKGDEVERRRKEFELWWTDVGRSTFAARERKQVATLKLDLAKLVADLERTKDRAKAENEVVLLLERHRLFPGASGTQVGAMASGEYSDQEAARRDYAHKLVNSSIMRSQLDSIVEDNPGIAEVWYEDEVSDFARKIGDVIAAAHAT